MESREADPESSWRHPGWRVVVVTFVLGTFGWGFGFYGHAVYLAELTRLNGWPAGLVGGASTLCFLAGAVLVAFVAEALARFGARRLVIAATLAMALATALLPLITAPWQLYAVTLVMACGWAGMGLGAITNLIGLWFRTRRGLAISLALNGASCGGIVISPLLVALSAGLGFAPAMWLMTGAMLVLLVPLALAGLGQAPPVPAAGGAAPAAAWTHRRALGEPRFWGICAPFALALIAQVGFIVHQIAFIAPLAGRGGAALAVAVTTVMAVTGRLCLGFAIDRMDQRLAATFSIASQGAALAVMPFTENAALILACCAVFGFSIGNLLTFPALIIQREFDAASFGRLIALTTAICQFTYAFGPLLLGLLRDLTGSYTAPLLFCAALKAAAAVMIVARRQAVR